MFLILFIDERCMWMEKPADSQEPQLPSDSGEAGELPVKLEADFAPLKEADTTDPADESDPDPHHDESLRAQEAFELATRAAAAGDEERAVRQYLKASNLAEAAREWYLAAVSCQRVGTSCKTTGPWKIWNGRPHVPLGGGRLRAVRPLRRGPPPLVPLDGPEDAAGAPAPTPLAGAGPSRPLLGGGGLRYRPRRIIGSAVAWVTAYGLLYWATGGVVTAVIARGRRGSGSAFISAGSPLPRSATGISPGPPHATCGIDRRGVGRVRDRVFCGGTSQSAPALAVPEGKGGASHNRIF